MTLITGQVEPVIDLTVRRLCTKAYRGHPRGCPNWNKRVTCPPQAPAIRRILDLSQPCYAVVSRFDLGAHVERMREKHPDWSIHQLRNVLYWQATARKVLNRGVNKLLHKYPGLVAITCPEAGGLVVGETVRQIGAHLEWMPQKWDHHVALAGHPVEGFDQRYPAYAESLQWGAAATEAR